MIHISWYYIVQLRNDPEYLTMNTGQVLIPLNELLLQWFYSCGAGFDYVVVLLCVSVFWKSSRWAFSPWLTSSLLSRFFKSETDSFFRTIQARLSSFCLYYYIIVIDFSHRRLLVGFLQVRMTNNFLKSHRHFSLFSSVSIMLWSWWSRFLLWFPILLVSFPSLEVPFQVQQLLLVSPLPSCLTVSFTSISSKVQVFVYVFVIFHLVLGSNILRKYWCHSNYWRKKIRKGLLVLYLSAFFSNTIF